MIGLAMLGATPRMVRQSAASVNYPARSSRRAVSRSNR